MASPHVTEDPKIKPRSPTSYFAKFKIHARRLHRHLLHTAAEVIIDGVPRSLEQARTSLSTVIRPPRRHPDREAAHDRMLGPIEFDENGDLKNKIISVFKITKNDKRSRWTTRAAQYKYVGVAPSA